MYILYTVLYIFRKVLTRSISLTIKSFFSCCSLLYSPDLNVRFRDDIVRQNANLGAIGLVTQRCLTYLVLNFVIAPGLHFSFDFSYFSFDFCR